MVKCAICKLKDTITSGRTFQFEQSLKSLKIEGKYAHTKCLRVEMDKKAERRRKYGPEEFHAV